MEKRPINGTAGDGVSASADRLAERPCKEPPIIPATGVAAGDGVSDSTAGDEDGGHTYYIVTEPNILEELGKRVTPHTDREAENIWFEELQNGWKESMTREEATRLVMGALEKVHKHYVYFADLEGFLLHYGLLAGDEHHGVSDCAAGDEDDGPTYDLETLADHIKNFDNDPMILDELGKRVTSEREAVTTWFKELRNAWKEPMTSEEATGLVKGALEKVHKRYVYVADVERVLLHYGIPIIPATGGGVPYSTAGDEYDGPTYDFETLADHIKNFHDDPKILDELGNRVGYKREYMTPWFEELQKAWTLKEPKTPAEAAILVMDARNRVGNCLFTIFELESFLLHYGLPAVDEYDGPTYDLETYADHIKNFDDDPMILDELGKRVTSEREALTFW